MSTRFTELIGCDLPVQLAGMGGVGTTELAAAVVAAGGLGMVPSRVPPAPGACGINFLVPFSPALDVIEDAARRARVVEFFYGDPRRDLVEAVHRGGAVAGWQVGSAAEAVAAAEAGSDYIVIQGTEAGGHVRGKQLLDDAMREVLDATRLPLVAAGGIASARRVAELIGAGADAVRVGTRFVATFESGAHSRYVQRLLEASGEDTTLTTWFGQGWENAPHRVLTACIAAGRASGWRETVPPNKEVGRDVDDMAMYAGMGVGEITKIEAAGSVMADLVRLLD
ncbi:MAG TPA: nitronate monooxygenase [Candidatus Dormibacteraeota bacterium]